MLSNSNLLSVTQRQRISRNEYIINCVYGQRHYAENNPKSNLTFSSEFVGPEPAVGR